MRPSAAEAFKAAFRRALPVVLVLVLVGAAAVYALRQAQGAHYQASARVVHYTTDLGAVLTGTQPAYTDPERMIDTAIALASSPELYKRAAGLVGGVSGDTLRASTTVTRGKDTDVVVITSTRPAADEAVKSVNAVASEYIRWRAEISGAAIREAIRQVEASIRTAQASSGRRDQDVADLRNQLSRLKVLETLNSGGAELIERATTARRVSPRPVRDALFGGALGFVVALLLSGAREAFNTRIRSEADVEDALGRPVLASIQTLPKRAPLVTLGRHESRFGDTYALLAANLMQIRGRSDRSLVLAVTSAIAGEGKTTTACNLAVAMAQRGHRVVLVDFDLRKPSVARVFKIPPDSPGIVQLVDGQAELGHTLWAVPLNGAAGRPVAVSADGNGSANGRRSTDSIPDEDGSLRVVSAGSVERGARIARSPRLTELLQELTKDADVVVLDTPPALATVEMAELSRNVDMVLTVVRHGRVTRRSLLQLSRQSDGWQTEIVGAVITDAPAEEDEYYYK